VAFIDKDGNKKARLISGFFKIKHVSFLSTIVTIVFDLRSLFE
jgi:hypothetical protein